MDLRNRIEYALFRALEAVLHATPPERGAAALAALSVRLQPLLRRRRAIVLDQLARVDPELTPSQQRSLADEVFAHLGRTAAEVFGPGADELLARARVEPGWEVLDRALAGGRGAIAVTGHIGNFELGGALLARRYPLLDVVKPQRNPYFDRRLQALRRARGIATVAMADPARAVLAHLRAGGLVSLLVDQDAGKAGAQTRFLGLPAATWTGAARFALRTGCPVVPLAMRRRAPGEHVLLIGEPVAAPESGSTGDRRTGQGRAGQEEVVREYTSRISAAVEQYILQEPAQWFWVHRRWKGGRET